MIRPQAMARPVGRRPTANPKFEIRNPRLSDDRLPADKQGWRTNETTTGLEPAQIGADSLDSAQQPAKAPSQLDNWVPASHLVTIEPYSRGNDAVAI